MNCTNGTVSSTYGLNYTVYCASDHNIPDSDNFLADNLQTCIDDCTERPTCFAVTWASENKRCWRSAGLVRQTDIVPSVQTTITAVPFESQMIQDPEDFVCPYPNLSMQRMKSGILFKIICGGYYGDGDYNLAGFHTGTMDECIELCVTHHPLCTRISFNSDMGGSGWRNCWLKSKSNAKPTPYTRTMGHSAHVILPSLEKMDCQNDAILTSENGERFKVSCNDLRKLDDKSTPPMVMSHETSAEDCMQRCSGVNFTCAAAMYDFGLSSGLQNCYLFDHLPPSQETNADMTLFYLESLSHQFSPPPRNTPGASNKNWVAGAVIGSVLVAGFGIWWSKRMVKKYNRFIFKTRKVKL